MTTEVEQYKEKSPAKAGLSRVEKMRKEFEELERLDNTVVLANIREMIAKDDMEAAKHEKKVPFYRRILKKILLSLLNP